MEFFVSWTDSDPEYPIFDANCSLLVSPPVFSRAFRLTRLAVMPRRIMVDSGAYTLRKRFGDEFTQQQLFEWQINMLDGVDLDRTQVLLSHLDQPLESGLPRAEAYRRMELTIARAWDFLTLAQRSGMDKKVELVGVIQGYDADSIRWCSRELKRLGFHRFGIGSLAMLFNQGEIETRIKAALQEVGQGLHVFGISSIPVLRALRDLGVASVDSSRPVKEAMFYVLLYSNPFRRFALAGRRRQDMGSKQLKRALPCPCPVCRVNPRRMFGVGSKRFTNYRAVHNYYHLKCEVSGCAAWAEPLGGEN